MLLDKSPWAYQTSEETSYSGWIISGGEGNIYFQHETSGDELVVGYNFASAGTAKGAVVNFAQSMKSDPSGGLVGNNVRVRPGWSFGPDSFPCHGWMLIGGVTAGIFQPSFMAQSGGDIALMIFGTWPFAAIPVWGRFNSILPSAGGSLAICQFTKDKSHM